jgi:hypothetical protein
MHGSFLSKLGALRAGWWQHTLPDAACNRARPHGARSKSHRAAPAGRSADERQLLAALVADAHGHAYLVAAENVISVSWGLHALHLHSAACLPAGDRASPG